MMTMTDRIEMEREAEHRREVRRYLNREKASNQRRVAKLVVLAIVFAVALVIVTWQVTQPMANSLITVGALLVAAVAMIKAGDLW